MVGDFLVGIGDEDITHLDHESTVELIIETKRPVVLHFEKANEPAEEPKNEVAKDTKKDEVAKPPVPIQVAVPFPVLEAEYEIIGVVKEYMKTMSKQQAKNPVESVKEVFSNAFKAADTNGTNSLNAGDFENCILGMGIPAKLFPC